LQTGQYIIFVWGVILLWLSYFLLSVGFIWRLRGIIEMVRDSRVEVSRPYYPSPQPPSMTRSRDGAKRGGVEYD